MAARKKKVAKLVEKMTTSMRLPIALKERLDRAAKGSGRSLTQEIEFRLERSFVEDAALGGPEMKMLAMEMVATFYNRGGREQSDPPKAWMSRVEPYTNAMMGVIDVLMRNHPDDKAEYLEVAIGHKFGTYGFKKAHKGGFIER